MNIIHFQAPSYLNSISYIPTSLPSSDQCTLSILCTHLGFTVLVSHLCTKLQRKVYFFIFFIMNPIQSILSGKSHIFFISREATIPPHHVEKERFCALKVIWKRWKHLLCLSYPGIPDGCSNYTILVEINFPAVLSYLNFWKIYWDKEDAAEFFISGSAKSRSNKTVCRSSQCAALTVGEWESWKPRCPIEFLSVIESLSHWVQQSIVSQLQGAGRRYGYLGIYARIHY